MEGTIASRDNSVLVQTCLGTNVSAWAQACLGTNVFGHKRAWAQSCGHSRVVTNVPGRSHVVTVVWAQSCMGTNVVEQYPATWSDTFVVVSFRVI